MKKFKKALSLLIVGIIAVTSLFCGTVTASAASSKVSLLSLDITKIDSKATDINYLGQDLYMLFDNDKNNYAIYRIDSNAIKKWRTTGKLNAQKITVDKKITDSSDWGGSKPSYFRYSNYSIFCSHDKDGKTYFHFVKYEKSKNRITEYYTTDSKCINVSLNGTIGEYNYDETNKSLKLNLRNTSGKIIKTIDLDTKDIDFKLQLFHNNNIFMLSTATKNNNDGSFSGEVAFYSTSGKKLKEISIPLYFGYVGNNYFAYSPVPIAVLSNVYDIDKDKEYTVYGTDLLSLKSDGIEYSLSADLGDKLYGTKAVGKYTAPNPNGNGEELSKYALIDVSTGKILSAAYDDMSTENNGKTFLVGSNDNYGYMNSKGKEIAMFTDAGNFFGNGKYAPIIKNGTIYLINKNMKQVSKTIKADKDSYVVTLSDELFYYVKGGKTYLFTNK